MPFSGSRSDKKTTTETKVRPLGSHVLEIVFRGHVTQQCVEFAVEEVRKASAVRLFLIDTLEVKHFETSVRRPGVELLHALKERGAVRGVTVAPSSAVRLIASAVSFVATMKVAFVPTRAEALKILETGDETPG